MKSQPAMRRLHQARPLALTGALTGCFLTLSVFAFSAVAAPIKIGAPIPITGPYSSDGGVMDKGERLAIDQLNEQGGLLGQKLEYTRFDIGDLTPDKLQAAATDLVDRDQVNVLINGYGGMGPDIPAFCPYQQPYIQNDATSNVLVLVKKMHCKNIFMGSDVDFDYGRITFEQLMATGYKFPNKKLAIIAGPYDWELNTTRGARNTAEKLGWQVVVNEHVPYGTKDWTGILTRLRDAQPALIYLELLDPASVNTLIEQFHDNPVKQSLLYVGYTVSVPAFGEVVKSGIADGVLGMTLSANRPDAKGRAFAALWRQKYHEEPPFSIAAQIYDEVMLWTAAVKKVGSATDYKAIADAIRDTAYDGVTGVIKFNKQQYVTSSDETVPTQLLQVQGSEVKQIMIGTKKNVTFETPPWIH